MLFAHNIIKLLLSGLFHTSKKMWKSIRPVMFVWIKARSPGSSCPWVCGCSHGMATEHPSHAVTSAELTHRALQGATLLQSLNPGHLFLLLSPHSFPAAAGTISHPCSLPGEISISQPTNSLPKGREQHTSLLLIHLQNMHVQASSHLSCF